MALLAEDYKRNGFVRANGVRRPFLERRLLWWKRLGLGLWLTLANPSILAPRAILAHEAEVDSVRAAATVCRVGFARLSLFSSEPMAVAKEWSPMTSMATPGE